MQRVFELTEQMKYVADKYSFEMSRSTSNAAFVLGKHLDDEDFVNSELFERLVDRVIDTNVNYTLCKLGLGMNLDPNFEKYADSMVLADDNTKLIVGSR